MLLVKLTICCVKVQSSAETNLLDGCENHEIEYHHVYILCILLLGFLFFLMICGDIMASTTDKSSVHFSKDQEAAATSHLEERQKKSYACRLKREVNECGFLSGLHPGLPAWEEPAEIFGVHGLLDEQVDLPPDAEHRALLHPLQLLLQPQQHPLRHFVEALAVTAGGRV